MSYASYKKLQRAQENLRKSRDELAIFTEIHELEKERHVNEQELRAQKQALKQERQAQKQEQALDKIKEAERMKEERRRAEFKTAQVVASEALDKARGLFHEKQKKIDKARAELQAISDDDPLPLEPPLFKAVTTAQELRAAAYVAKVAAKKAEGNGDAKARRAAELEAETKAMAMLAEWEAENSGKKGAKKEGAKAVEKSAKQLKAEGEAENKQKKLEGRRAAKKGGANAAAARAFVAEWEAENIGLKWDDVFE